MTDEGKIKVREHYGAVAEAYFEQYDESLLRDFSRPYPANFFRLERLVKSFGESKLDRVIEIGVGDGTPLAALARLGIDVWGFDLTSEMVNRARETLKKENVPESQIFLADIEDANSYLSCLPQGCSDFDGVVAMGVMPHVVDDALALRNTLNLVKPGGRIFIEFRNKLFSLFTFNRKTVEFVLEDLLKFSSPRSRDLVAQDLNNRLRVDMPPVRERVKDSGAPGYDVIPAKFHNPFEMADEIRDLGFKDIDFYWYHYHPSMPFLEDRYPQEYRDEALALEHEDMGWRGYFLASAFVIEAVRTGV